MHTEPVSASFRSLIEKCLQTAQSAKCSEPASEAGTGRFFQRCQQPKLTECEPATRTEVNIRVLEDYLRP